MLAILAVLAAAAIPAASHYIKLAEFRKNEANAKTAYLAAESVLTWYRASGEWENFRREIIQKGTPNQTFGETAADVEKNNRIYAVTLNSSQAEEPSISQELVRTLLGDCAYDQDFLNAAIAIEIDIETGQVYSAFYGTRCERLSYEEESGSVNISAAEGNRAYDSRKDRLTASQDACCFCQNFLILGQNYHFFRFLHPCPLQHHPESVFLISHDSLRIALFFCKYRINTFQKKTIHIALHGRIYQHIHRLFFRLFF